MSSAALSGRNVPVVPSWWFRGVINHTSVPVIPRWEGDHAWLAHPGLIRRGAIRMSQWFLVQAKRWEQAKAALATVQRELEQAQTELTSLRSQEGEARAILPRCRPT